MLFFSTNKKSPAVDFRQATINGQAPDRGLYFPETIPQLPAAFWLTMKDKSKEEIAFEVIKPYVGNAIADAELKRIVAETVNFEIPLVQISERIFSLELFHGPTLAFKDVGARFMSRCLGHFAADGGAITVLVATSGDTGGAVASGFDGVPGVRVVILYPSGKVSRVQEWQLTTGGNNILALEVNGDFDDCQRMVKQAFSDEALRSEIFLTSANSINVARWLPQQFYYFFALQQAAFAKPVFSVPSGNFGNIGAGLLAFRSCLPVSHFIAACNANDTVPRYLKGEGYHPHASIATISNAMDVSDPSNFVRILELMNHDDERLKSLVSADRISDDETIATMKEVYRQYGYVLDPHGAVAYLALERWLREHPSEYGIFLETAHPVKFPDSVESVLGKPLPIPDRVSKLQDKPKHSIPIPVSYERLKEVLLA